MARFLSSVFIAGMLCGCGRAGIDAAGAAADAAWGEFGGHLAEQVALLGSIEEPVCAAATGKEACVHLREAIKSAGAVDLAKVDPTDRGAVEPARRYLRSLGQAAERLGQFAGKEQPSDAQPAAGIARFKQLAVETAAASERYDTAVLAYNRALRTFPESVTNNMFLRLKSREYLNSDQRARRTNAGKR